MHKHGGDIYEYKDKIDYSANINFCGMPDTVRQAAIDAVEDSVHYPDVSCRALREAIAGKDGISPEMIFCGNGAADVIFSLVLAKKPRTALLPIPSFYEYEQALHSVNCQICPFELQEKQGFMLDASFLDAITPEIDLIFLCNPNNPTGVLTDCDFLEKILRKCEQTRTMLVVDECFNEFLESPESYTMLPFVMRSENLMILKAFTKIYAMPGLRLGYGICSDGGLLDTMERVSQPWRVSVPAQAAGIAACKETAYVEQSRQMIRQQRERMIQEMREMGYEITGSQANYIFFEGEHHLGDQMLMQGFLIRDCSNYRGLHLGYYRVAVRGDADNTRFLQALRRIHLGEV